MSRTSAPMLTFDMLSTPPATTRSASPRRTARAPWRTASRPEAHSRLTVMPGTVCGRPARSAAMRATLRLSSPAWLAQPSTTSETASGGTAGYRSRSCRMTCRARSSARTWARAPAYRPKGVRTPPTR